MLIRGLVADQPFQRDSPVARNFHLRPAHLEHGGEQLLMILTILHKQNSTTKGGFSWLPRQRRSRVVMGTAGEKWRCGERLHDWAPISERTHSEESLF